MPDGRFLVKDHARGLERMMTKVQLGDYLADHCTSPEHVPIGDYVHKLLSGLGLSGCLSCAERQAWLNRRVKK